MKPLLCVFSLSFDLFLLTNYRLHINQLAKSLLLESITARTKRDHWCQVCLDTDGILYTNTSPQTAHRDQINNYAPGNFFRANKLKHQTAAGAHITVSNHLIPFLLSQRSLRSRTRELAPTGLITCWRVLPLGQNVITGCQVCLDTDGILYTNTVLAVILSNTSLIQRLVNRLTNSIINYWLMPQLIDLSS